MKAMAKAGPELKKPRPYKWNPNNISQNKRWYGVGSFMFGDRNYFIV